jgi:hypothetical protein
MTKPVRVTRRSLARAAAALMAAGPAAAQEPAAAPVDELARAREAIRSQGRTLAAAAAKLPPETEPAFRFEA